MALPALPLIPIAVGLTGTAAGVAIHHWLTSEPPDAWEEKDIFNARMRDLHSLALAINDGFAKCPEFMNNAAQLAAWRGNRDNFGKFYATVGTKTYSGPSSGEIAQAKDYASKFYYWAGEYNRQKCGDPLPDDNKNIDPYNPNPPPATDWGNVAKWTAIGLGSVAALALTSNLIRSFGSKG